jgi:proline racemase
MRLDRLITVVGAHAEGEGGRVITGGALPPHPEVAGRAWLTGISQYGVDPEDPFPTGHRLGDTWFG